MGFELILLSIRIMTGDDYDLFSSLAYFVWCEHVYYSGAFAIRQKLEVSIAWPDTRTRKKNFAHDFRLQHVTDKGIHEFFVYFFLLPFNFNRQKIYSFHMFFEIKISNKYIYGKNALPATRSSVGSSAIARLKQQNMFFSSSFRLYVKVATITERWWTYEKKKKLQYQSCSINRCFAPQIVWWTIMRALLIMSNKFKWSFDRLCVFGYGCPYSCAHNDDHLISRVYDKLFFVCNQNDVITFLLLFIDRRVTTAFGW